MCVYFRLVDGTVPQHFVTADMSAEQISDAAQEYLGASGQYDLQDKLYERIARLPWAQLLQVDEVVSCEWHKAMFGVACILNDRERVFTFGTLSAAMDFADTLGKSEKSTAIIYDYRHNSYKHADQTEWLCYDEHPAAE